ncbi:MULTISPECIES: shikimate kinase [unclassified Arthrobacter]|uniref:shikimate kinase n=1 Tax=unclassified Arthrobacter TaxID=235627 RepID=UPI0027D7C6BE|nr:MULTISPECIES: shikimate kinase [unclassified Arthrobacter]
MPPLVVIGNTACGKTTVGRRIAELLKVPFVDLDDVIVARHGALPEIFAEGGEETFRNLEASTAADLITTATTRYVLAFGGGAIMRPETQNLLTNGCVVWIDADLGTVLPRLQARRNRPLLKNDIANMWQELDVIRRPVFRRMAGLRVDASSGSVDHLAQYAVEWALNEWALPAAYGARAHERSAAGSGSSVKDRGCDMECVNPQVTAVAARPRSL